MSPASRGGKRWLRLTIVCAHERRAIESFWMLCEAALVFVLVLVSYAMLFRGAWVSVIG
jgi:hypothetical protein